MGANTKVVVVGAGYAGVLAALRVKWALGRAAEVTLVSPTDVFVERVRLHQRFVCGRNVEHPLEGLLADTWVGLRVGRVMRVDVGRSQLQFEDGPNLDYEFLLLATGSVTDVGPIHGAHEHGVVLEGEGAAKARTRLALLPAQAPVTVIGGGLTGMELAAELAEHRPDLRVRLVSKSAPGAGLSAASARYVNTLLARSGVELVLGEAVEAVERDAVHVGRKALASALTVMATGLVAAPLARQSGLAVDGSGRLLVDSSLRVLGTPRLFAAGDAALVVGDDGRAVPLGCKSALPAGAHVAETLVAEVLGRPSTAWTFRDRAYCLSLGRRHGVVQLMNHDGTPSWLAIRGRWGARLKERVLCYTMQVLEKARRTAASRTTSGRPLHALPGLTP